MDGVNTKKPPHKGKETRLEGGRPLNFACFRIQRAKAGSKLVVFATFGLSAAASTDALPIWLKLNLKEGEEEARPRRRPFVTVGRTLFYIRVLYNAAED